MDFRAGPPVGHGGRSFRSLAGIQSMLRPPCLSVLIGVSCLAAVVWTTACGAAGAEESPARTASLIKTADPPAAAAEAARPADRATKAAAGGKYRAIVAGVETTIPPHRQEADTYSTHNIVEITAGIPNLQWTPKQSPSTLTLFELASSTTFRHKIWYLEFTFKPVRMIWVDVPQESGKMQRKLIWYLVYHVKNPGGHYAPKRRDDGTYELALVDEPVTFAPQFVLEAPEYKKAYHDRVIPVAIGPIQQREDPNRKLLNSIEMAAQPIPVSSERHDESAWGVATWEDIDPRVDFFSIFIQGLTNAYRWVDPPGGYHAGGEPGQGRILTHKTLVLNFWRPGDDVLEDERKVLFGIPGKVDYTWVYR